MRICRRVAFNLDTAGLIFARRKKLGADILIHLLKSLGHFADTFKHGIRMRRDSFNREIVLINLSAVIMRAKNFRANRSRISAPHQ